MEGNNFDLTAALNSKRRKASIISSYEKNEMLLLNNPPSPGWSDGFPTKRSINPSFQKRSGLPLNDGSYVPFRGNSCVTVQWVAHFQLFTELLA